MNLSLNKLRIILLSLMGIGLGILIAVSPVGFALLGGIVILGFIWLVAETGTHASYTMMIGKMLEKLFTSRPPKEPVEEKRHTAGSPDEKSGQDLQNGKVIGEIKPVARNHNIHRDGDDTQDERID